MGRSLAWVIFLMLSPSVILGGVEDAWGLWSQSSKLRHSSEGAVWTTPQTLELRRWHEFAERESVCELSHALIYGRVQLRSATGPLPLEKFFSENPSARSVSLVIYKMRRGLKPLTPAPYAPNSASKEEVKAALANRMPRVAWQKDEGIEPLFRMTMSRDIWQSLKNQLPRQRNLSRSQYDATWCQKLKGALPPVELVKAAS